MSERELLTNLTRTAYLMNHQAMSYHTSHPSRVQKILYSLILAHFQALRELSMHLNNATNADFERDFANYKTSYFVN